MLVTKRSSLSAMTRVGVVGASGYTGLELIKMILKHPHFTLSMVATTEGQTTIDKVHPSLLGVCDMPVVKADTKELAKSCDLIFLALPHMSAMGYVKELMREGVKVVDLSADYRLDQDTYEKYYVPHTDVKNLAHAVYGLAEINKEEIKKAVLVASPGCYPTASVLAILPFMKYYDKKSPIIIDAKTGVSGSGKKLCEESHFVNIHENSFAYKPLNHRHSPEIAQTLGLKPDNIKFVPHLLPLTRGMICSIYINIDSDFDPLKVLKEFYKDERFVRIRETPVTMKQVAGTHFCDIYATVSGNTLFINSAIDNLLRGASSQAILSANLMMGYSESAGVSDIAYVP